MTTSDPVIRLRPIQTEDAPRIHEWASQPEACRYQPWGPNTEDETTRFVEAAVESWEDPVGKRRVWAAEQLDLGVVGLGELKRVSRSTRELAYAVHTSYWGGGVGTRIGILLLDEAFSDPAVERVQATCDPRNIGSATVLERLGMSLEGTMRHTILVRDGWRDSRLYSILRAEQAGEADGRHPSTAP